MENNNVILEVKNLKQHFTIGSGTKKSILKAVDGISFHVNKGEVFSLVGESGCGKTTTGRSLIGLYEPTDGEIKFMGEDIYLGTTSLKDLKRKLRHDHKKEVTEINNSDLSDTEKTNKIQELKNELATEITEINNRIKNNIKVNKKSKKETMKQMQMIFQDPIASLNPRMTVKEIVAEGLRIDGVKNEKEITERVNNALDRVGLLPEHANRYPHEFSGGQRQRIGIARALIVEPKFIIADEPISALDISIQAQVINLLNDLRDELGITILFIAHDLSVVKYFSDRIAVMYFGKIVEMGDKESVFSNPVHPYTRALISAIPVADPDYEKSRKQRLVYSPTIHDYSVDKPKMVEITPNHFVYGNEQELKKYKKLWEF